MRRWWWIGLLGALLVVMVVMATFPASLAWRQVEHRLPELRLQGVEGTIWSGQAYRLAVRGQPLGVLRWQLSPWALLRGTAQVDWNLQGPGLQLSARLSVSGADERVLENVTGEADAGWLGPALAIPELEPTGQLRVEGARVRLDGQGLPRDVDARLDWLNAGVRGKAVARLGTLHIVATGADGEIDLDVADGGDGELEVRGGATLRGHHYRSEIVLIPRVSEGPVVEAMQWVGEPRAGGGRLLIVEGQILVPEELL